MKILVTGGAGYIGSHTVLALIEHGYDPIILDDFSNADERIIAELEGIAGRSLTVYKVDCKDQNTLQQVFEEEPNIQGVIHFAAFKAVGESVEQPLKYFENNVGSLIALLQICKEYRVQNIVFSSSCTVYGEPDTMPVTESTPIKPAISPYGETKQICERILLQSYLSMAGRVSLLRYFNPIGAHASGRIGELPHGVPNNLVPHIQQTAAGIRNELTVHGNDYDTHDGTCIRDYIDVNDLANAHCLALQWMAEQNEPVIDVVNLGVGQGRSVLEVIETFSAVNEVSVPYMIGPRRNGDVVSIWADNTKARHQFGWKPQFSLADSLKHAWKWQQYVEANW